MNQFKSSLVINLREINSYTYMYLLLLLAFETLLIILFFFCFLSFSSTYNHAPWGGWACMAGLKSAYNIVTFVLPASLVDIPLLFLCFAGGSAAS